MRRHQSNLSWFCRRMLRDADAAEDATQETLIRVFHALADFESRAEFKTCLFTIARNVCLTRLNGTAKEAQLQDTYARDQELTNHIDTPAECKREIDELLAAMPVEVRENFALRFVVGLSLQEIADSHALTLSAAKMRLYRAVDQLRARSQHGL